MWQIMKMASVALISMRLIVKQELSGIQIIHWAWEYWHPSSSSDLQLRAGMRSVDLLGGIQRRPRLAFMHRIGIHWPRLPIASSYRQQLQAAKRAKRRHSISLNLLATCGWDAKSCSNWPIKTISLPRRWSKSMLKHDWNECTNLARDICPAGARPKRKRLGRRWSERRCQ